MTRETLGIALRCGLFAGLALASSGYGAAAQDNNFYKGKKLTFLINFTPGGPTDFEGRLVARHIARHIPGAPVIIPRNMPGAGGVVGLNWLGKIAPRDGTVVGFLTGAASKATMGDPGIKVDILKMGFIASGPGTSVAYIRTDVAPGMKTPADILKATSFWAAGLSPESDKDVRIRMQLDMLGLTYKYISGYRGSAETRLALQRGEIQMTAESMPTYRASIEPGLIKPGTAIPLWYDPFDDGKSFSTPPEAAGIAAETFTSFYRRVKGEPPKGLIWDSYRVVNNVGTLFLRTILAPVGTPPAAIAALKDGLVKMQQDPVYKAEAVKAIRYVPRYVTDADMEAIFRKTIAPPREIRAFFRSYIEKGKSVNNRKKQ
jgi:tripartite-type tricarboxylate transporter receptor subunit TctC